MEQMVSCINQLYIGETHTSQKENSKFRSRLQQIIDEVWTRPEYRTIEEMYLPIDADTVKVRAIAIQAAQVSKYIYLKTYYRSFCK